jgi:hypothetical protein
MWIEEYHGCGCSIGPVKKSELVGYCAIHGGNWKVRRNTPNKNGNNKPIVLHNEEK